VALNLEVSVGMDRLVMILEGVLHARGIMASELGIFFVGTETSSSVLGKDEADEEVEAQEEEKEGPVDSKYWDA